jgi:hypothetical protein
VNGSSFGQHKNLKQRKRMNTEHEAPRTLRESEREVMAEGREWTSKRLQQRLQEEADRHGGVSPLEPKPGGASAQSSNAAAD